MRIDDFIEASNQAATTDEVFALLQRAVAELGFDRVMYRALRNHPDVVLPCMARSYPDEWMTHYVAKGYVDSDPVGHRCLTSNLPFRWWDSVDNRRPETAVIFHEAEEVGLKDGVAVPLHGPAGECVGIGFASTDGKTEAKAHLQRLQLLSVQFHTVHSSLTRAVPAEAPRLTPREREILLWCAKGKSSWSVGQILHIAEHSVEWHLRNIFRKLGVDSRITAVVKALHLGLISL
ncbi:MAG: LuxR family transcriptional regulator [Magnetospirillum sp.]|nr:LuxR family transcriptional regulator [Magnetospirillum sp.]